jgi:hypothetical protein
MRAGIGCRELADRAVRRRHGGVAACRLGHQLDAQIALLGGADQGGGPVEPVHHPLGDEPSLVEDELRPYAAPLEERGDGRRALPAADFLVVAEGEIEGAIRLEALGEQRLGRLQDRQHPHLVVQRSPAPDPAALDQPRERGMRPVLLRARLHGHHVLVGHQQDGRERRVLPLPGVEQAVIRHDLPAERGVNPGEALGEVLVQSEKGPGLDVPAVLMGDSGEAQRSREPPGGGRSVDGRACHRLNLDLTGSHRGRTHAEDGEQNQQDETEGGEELLHETSAVARNCGALRTFVACSNA